LTCSGASDKTAAQDVPVVVLTSSREEPDIAECYRLGVNSYIVKPVAFDQFTEAVRELGSIGCCSNEAACKRLKGAID